MAIDKLLHRGRDMYMQFLDLIWYAENSIGKH